MEKISSSSVWLRIVAATTWLRIIAASVFLFCGTGNLSAQRVTVTPLGTDYQNHTVTLRVVCTGTTVPANRVWVWIDYCPVAGVTSGTYGPASITAVRTGSALNGRGFFVTGSPATITATLYNPPAKFNWCAYGSGYAPQALLQANGSYLLKGAPPFKVNGVRLAAGATVAGPGTCIASSASFTDLTGHPEGIVSALPVVGTTSPAARCGAGAVTLTATAGGGTTTSMTYTWKVGAAAATTTAGSYPVANAAVGSTAYSVSVRNAAGCTSTVATGAITVNALPEATSLTANPAAICTGQSATLTAAAAGAVSYSFDGGASWQTAATKSVSPTTTTTYTLRVRNTAGCVSPYSKTAIVTVNPLPVTTSLTTNPMSVCAGQSATLTAVATDAALYSFDNGSSFGTAATLAVSPASYTTYSLRVRSAAGCKSTVVRNAAVTVNKLPAITSFSANTTSICIGRSATLTARATDAASYSFDGGASWQTAATQAVSPTATTAYTLRVRGRTGCTTTDTRTLTVTVNPLPTIRLVAGSSDQNGTTGTALPAVRYMSANAKSIALVSGRFPHPVAGRQNGNTYDISGTPKGGGTYNYTLRAESTYGCAAATTTGSMIIAGAGCNPSTGWNGPWFFESTKTWVSNGVELSDLVASTTCRQRGYNSSGKFDNSKLNCASYLGSPVECVYSRCLVTSRADVLCPGDWHVADKDDYMKFSGSTNTEKMKSAAMKYGWDSGFGRMHYLNEKPSFAGTGSYWWALEGTKGTNMYLRVTSDGAYIRLPTHERHGFGVRCARNR
ncbi:MAG: hypothetical protein LBI89_02160 [Prevotellaceae bacterium]|jgi:hypothetical protein|nr:hypothetical protein [Prevotellaceae bacterium]